jgi:hypothetical protein
MGADQQEEVAANFANEHESRTAVPKPDRKKKISTSGSAVLIFSRSAGMS